MKELISDWKVRRHKPGETCKVSGQYSLTDKTQTTLVKGDTFPPTPRPRMGWKLTDKTKGKGSN